MNSEALENTALWYCSQQWTDTCGRSLEQRCFWYGLVNKSFSVIPLLIFSIIKEQYCRDKLKISTQEVHGFALKVRNETQREEFPVKSREPIVAGHL